jgi:hypothetical protein
MKKSYRFSSIFLLLCMVFIASNLFAQDSSKPAAEPVLNKAEIEKEATLHCELSKLELQKMELDDDAKMAARNAKIEAAGNALEKHAMMTGEKYVNKITSDLFVNFFTAALKKCKTSGPE